MSDSAVFPITDLYLFPVYTRDSYEQAFGRQAPPFDPERRAKHWFDPDAGDGPYEYQYFDFTTRSFQHTVIPGHEARSVNLPGRYRYEPYDPGQTPAVILGPDGQAQPMSPYFLCTREEAEELARSLGAEGVEEAARDESVFRVDWRGEARREYYIILGGERHNAGALLRARNAYGVGAPGVWYFTDSGPVWTPLPVPDGLGDPRPPVPVPCRGLRPNERLHITPFGVMVYRTDLDSPITLEAARDEAARTEADFRAEVLRRLGRIEALLERLPH